jgi:hypothetical protein
MTHCYVQNKKNDWIQEAYIFAAAFILAMKQAKEASNL